MGNLSEEYRAEFSISVEGQKLLTVTYVQPDTGLVFEQAFGYVDDHVDVKFLIPLGLIRKDTKEDARHLVPENQVWDIREIAAEKAAERYGSW